MRDFIVAGASGGIASIRSDVYLENKWAAPYENMNMIVKARQAESNLLADKKASETGVIAGEATSVKSVQLDVPVPGATMAAAAEGYAPPMKQEPGFEVIAVIAARILVIALRRRS